MARHVVTAVTLIVCCASAENENVAPRIKVDTEATFNSSQWPSWGELETTRNILGTMNGPREVLPCLVC